MNKTVLILDDEPWQLTWVSDLLRSKGWTPVFVESYGEAVAEFGRLSPSLVIIDIRIGDDAPPPEGETVMAGEADWIGLRFLRHVRVERRSRVEVLVYTGVDRDDLAKAVEEGLSARFFSKFDSRHFAEELERLVDNK